MGLTAFCWCILHWWRREERIRCYMYPMHPLKMGSKSNPYISWQPLVLPHILTPWTLHLLLPPTLNLSASSTTTFTAPNPSSSMLTSCKQPSPMLLPFTLPNLMQLYTTLPSPTPHLLYHKLPCPMPPLPSCLLLCHHLLWCCCLQCPCLPHCQVWHCCLQCFHLPCPCLLHCKLLHHCLPCCHLWHPLSQQADVVVEGEKGAPVMAMAMATMPMQKHWCTDVF